METNGRKIHKMEWFEFDEAVDELCTWLENKEYDYIFGIPRGGLILGVVLSHRLNIPLLLPNQSIKFGTNIRMLVIDDISDSGKTLKEISELLIDNKFEIDIMTLYVQKESKVIPDYYYEEVDNVWILFPWETEESSVNDYFERRTEDEKS